MKKGFTLAEMVITIGIISFVTVVTIPLLKKVMPDKERLLFKKAYYITERIVSELVNDEDLYPESDNPIKQNLANLEPVVYKGKTYEGKTKFCGLFAAKLNIASGFNGCKGDLSDPSFITSDGIKWALLEAGDGQFPTSVFIDVNGDKGPNCYCTAQNCPKPDKFRMYIYKTGRVEPQGDIAKEYLKSDKVAKDDR